MNRLTYRTIWPGGGKSRSGMGRCNKAKRREGETFLRHHILDYGIRLLLLLLHVPWLGILGTKQSLARSCDRQQPEPHTVSAQSTP